MIKKIPVEVYSRVGGVVVTWAASNNDPVIFQVPLPPNLNTSADLVVHIRAKSGGATDTPTIAADTYFNEGDTKVEDATAAVSASYAELTVTVAAADVPAGAQTMSMELTPGAHTTDISDRCMIGIKAKQRSFPKGRC